MPQIELGGFNGLVVEPVAVTGMVVDIDKTGAYEETFGIDCFAAFGNGKLAHFAKGVDLAVLDQQDGIGDQMIPHDQSGIFNGKHIMPPSAGSAGPGLQR